MVEIVCMVVEMNGIDKGLFRLEGSFQNFSIYVWCP